MTIRILPYKQGSKSAKALATALGGKVLKLVGSSFQPQATDTIINWGNANAAYNYEGVNVNFLNKPDYIKNVSNKLTFFELLRDEGITPRFWTKQEEIPDEAFPIVCRTILSGHSGAGIVISDSRADLVPAPLYVEYKNKKAEYRIHLGRRYEFDNDGYQNTSITTICVQRKVRKTGHTVTNWQVRNLKNGFIYQRNNVSLPKDALEKAKKAFEKSGLDFGAVDVIWNATEDRSYVLEINTAPGITGSTITDYARYFRGDTEDETVQSDPNVTGVAA